ncbi:MAG TPA: hypothetical protein VGK16_12730 [Candidatus Limnocylindrales bacterium]|jgi:hypothetical protein
MRTVLLRLALLTVGMAIVEVVLAGDPSTPIYLTAPALVAGLLSLVAGSVGFMTPLLNGGPQKGRP